MTLKTLPVVAVSSPIFSLTPFSWLFLTRRRRILILTLCSPVLLPLLCLCLPLLFLLCLFRRRRSNAPPSSAAGTLQRCEEGRKYEDEEEEEEEEREIGWMLLQRYLEDQLGLVGSVVVADYDCGGDDDDEVIDGEEIRRSLLI